MVPWVRDSEGRRVRYEPAELLEHLTAQILNNFVLKAKELREDAQHRGHPDFDRKRTHLTITVPSTYSPTHIRRLERFIRRHVDVGVVETMYESDAVAHFMMDMLTDELPEVRDMKLHIARKLRASARVGTASLRLVTIDIGRGTTDFSLFHFDLDHSARTFTYNVLARTGRGHGGARLSYILAEHMNVRISSVLDSFSEDPELDPRVKHAIQERRSRMSVLDQPDTAVGRGTVLHAAERLTEAIKRNLDDDYQVRASASLDTFAMDLASVLCQEIAHATSIVPILALAGPVVDETAEARRLWSEIEKIREALAAALCLPPALPTARKSGLNRILSRFGNPSSPVDDAFVELRERLEHYIRRTVDNPLQQLIEMAEGRDKEGKRRGLFSLETVPTFVVVAGQASHFGPIRKAIREQVRETMDLPTGLEGHLLFLPGRLAKLACCLGALWCYRAPLHCNNPEEMLGTYGFLQRFSPFELVNLDMRRLNKMEEPQEVLLMNGEYWLIFQPRYLPPGRMSAAEMDADSVAYIQTFRFSHGGQVRVRYLGLERGMEVSERDRVHEVRIESTVGDIRGREDKIYADTWPDILPPCR